MIDAGMNVARLSLAHGPLEETLDRMARVRAAAIDARRFIGVLADLPGPKIRASAFPDAGVHLTEGDAIDVVPSTGGVESDVHRLAVDLPALLDELQVGDKIVLGDGAISLLVEQVHADRAVAEVVSGGWVQGRPGVALPAGRFNQESPTEEDLELIDGLCKAGVDSIAVSFVCSGADVRRAKDAVDDRGPMVIAKIETQEAVDNRNEIIEVADGVMVARGDLGIRCAIEDVPHYQKRIIRAGVAYGRPVITATQMLESMVRAPTPTRAEVSDVANAVFDGTSALMLSGETAIGHSPAAAVRTMAKVALRAEREFDYGGWGRNLGRLQSAEALGAAAEMRITAAVSAAAWRASIDAGVTAIIACTNRGSTPRAISRFRPTVPILAATPHEQTARQLSMAWGIEPMIVDRHSTTDEIVWFAVEAAAARGVVRKGDVVAVVVGSPTDPVPVTDTLRLVRVR